MSADNNTVRATAYLRLRPEYRRYYSAAPRDTPDAISGAKVVGATQNKSQHPKPGTVEVKLTIEIPKGAFLPLRPEAIVIVPESMAQPHPLTVEAEDANEVGE